MMIVKLYKYFIMLNCFHRMRIGWYDAKTKINLNAAKKAAYTYFDISIEFVGESAK